nr:MAG TPA: hypothetical protein [Caudoviricetes sp.]
MWRRGSRHKSLFFFCVRRRRGGRGQMVQKCDRF